MSDRRQNTAGVVHLSVRDVHIEIELLPSGALITASMDNGKEKKMLLSESESPRQHGLEKTVSKMFQKTRRR